jgi:hypothetical protein
LLINDKKKRGREEIPYLFRILAISEKPSFLTLPPLRRRGSFDTSDRLYKIFLEIVGVDLKVLSGL